MELRWTKLALIDLNEAFAYIAGDNPQAASSITTRIVELTYNLIHHPGMGRPGRVPGTRELVISGTPYLVAYRIRGDKVELLRVVHAARKWPKRL